MCRVSGKKCSRASADAANIKRSISDLSRQHGGRKMDYLFKTRDAGTEVGCGECGLIAGVNTTKELQDCGFKMPKVMKDMMFRLVLESPGVMNKLCISGVYIGQNVLKLSILDCPAGYVTRYDAFNPVDYPMTESKIRRQLAAVLKMILSARLIMQDAKQKLDDDDSEIVLGKQRHLIMQPSFTLNVVYNKKRKL
ncbi:uncharacterized protein ATC70_007615 [Mucor velutinosus]|uniref:Uncharacterized protein n=1 Tax=Mucor velutinosus TaxID=708070 RepID=A0AAN7D7H4_9FUNG|nr:hypothetical protein ATC70_007615 [Mucor velutinosus]